MSKDLFAHKSKNWDKKSRRVINAKNIAHKAIENIKLSKDMTLMDFGVGTGLLSYFFAPYVSKIVGVDNSKSMLEVFKGKSNEFECETSSIMIDYTKNSIDVKFDGIISSMTLHHVEDIEKLFFKFFSQLKGSGFIALADLKAEDGTFHSDNTGVFHFGFDEDFLKATAQKTGFENIRFITANTIQKPQRDYEVFLMLGEKL